MELRLLRLCFRHLTGSWPPHLLNFYITALVPLQNAFIWWEAKTKISSHSPDLTSSYSHRWHIWHAGSTFSSWPRQKFGGWSEGWHIAFHGISLQISSKDSTYNFSWQLVAGARKLQFSVSPGQWRGQPPHLARCLIFLAQFCITFSS